MSQNNPKRTVMVQGRIVWVLGNLFQGGPKIDQNTNRQVINDKGEPVKEYGFGLAVPKSVLGQTGAQQPGEIWAAIHEEAYKIYTNRQTPPDFAWKYKDGDGIDHNGKPFAEREGYTGHIVFNLKTQIPLRFYKFDSQANKNIQIEEGIKCGDYVNVQVMVEAHPPVGRGKAGLYLNPMAVQFLGYGKEIVNAPSGDQIFGNSAPALPSGASATPIAQPGFLVPTEGAPQAPGFNGGFNQTLTPPQAPAAPAQPHYAVLPPQFQPPQQAAPAQLPNQGFAPPAPAQVQQQWGVAPAPQQQMPAPGGFPIPGQR